MPFDGSSFLVALGLAIILEAIPYFLFAEKMPQYFRSLAQLPPPVLRLLAAVGLALGMVLVAVGRSGGHG